MCLIRWSVIHCVGGVDVAIGVQHPFWYHLKHHVNQAWLQSDTYVVVHYWTVEAAYDGLSEVGGASDEERHCEQEEGGGGVQLHHQVLGGERGGGDTSQVAKHLIDSD